MNKYLFFDRGLFNGRLNENIQLTSQPIIKERHPLLKEAYWSPSSIPWEVRFDNSYPTVLYIPELKIYRCYYSTFIQDTASSTIPISHRNETPYHPKSDRIVGWCLAESKDGIQWYRPDLHIVNFNGNTNNNILIEHAHGTGIMYDDTEKKPDKRYKIMTRKEENGIAKMMIGFSADGIHFNLQNYLGTPAEADTHNFIFRDWKSNKYILITRLWRNSVRVLAMCESEDFIHWTDPQEICRGKGFENETYAMIVFQLKDYYMGLLSTYHNGDIAMKNFDTVDCQLMFATYLDGWNWVSNHQEAFIPRGEGNYPSGDFDSGCIFSSPPLYQDGRYWFYYLGSNGRHSSYREGAIARGYIEEDKWAYYQARDSEKQATLQLIEFTFIGKSLSLILELSELSELSLHIMDQNFQSVLQLDLSDFSTRGNYYSFTMDEETFDRLKGQVVMPRIHFRHCSIYGICGDLIIASKRY